MSTRIAFTESSSLVPTTLFAISGSLAVGDAVCQVAGADKTVAKADADNASARPPIGVVHEIRGTDAVVALNGEVAAGLTGLTRGTAYWLSTTAGALVATKPATNAYLVGVAVSASELLVNTVAADLIIGGGGGSVTSFGVTSSDITVSNSPITSSGVIDLALNTVPVSKGGTGLTSATEQGASLIASSSSAYVAQATSLSWRNRIINGDMRVAQRGTTAVNDNYPVDRWWCGENTSGAALFQQSATAPTGFVNSILATCSTGGSATGSQYATLGQNIEGSNVYDFAYGTAAAKQVTLSFWVRSSVTGTYCVAFRNTHGITARQSYIAEYVISASNTWERKTIVVPGPTSGIWTVDTSTGLSVNFDLGSGSSWNTTANTWTAGAGPSGGGYLRTSNQANVIGTTGATFYLTGVQLELGSVATPFEMLQYEKQLELCQRYYARLSSLSGNNVGFGAGATWQGGASAGRALVYVKYPQQMRSTPTVTQSGTAIYNTLVRTLEATPLGTANYGTDSLSVNVNTGANTQTVGQGVLWTGNSSTAYIELNAEL